MNSAHNVLHRNTQAVEKAPPGRAGRVGRRA